MTEWHLLHVCNVHEIKTDAGQPEHSAASREEEDHMFNLAKLIARVGLHLATD